MNTVLEKLAGEEQTDRVVLIQGKRGSGRRFVAREIHHRSPRQGQPFVSYDCRGRDALEVRRSLLGQIRELAPGHYLKYLGVLEEVRDGTLYLDGVEGLSAKVQGELAAVFEGRSFNPIGGEQAVPFRGRVIASSAEDLEPLVADGEFHAHLFKALAEEGICLKLLRKE